jgi:hypothetical protein
MNERKSETIADRQSAPRDLAASTPAAGDGEGSIQESDLTARDIRRVTVDQFEVGGYRYTSLKDAIAQSARSKIEQGSAR